MYFPSWRLLCTVETVTDTSGALTGFESCRSIVQCWKTSLIRNLIFLLDIQMTIPWKKFTTSCRLKCFQWRMFFVMTVSLYQGKVRVWVKLNWWDTWQPWRYKCWQIGLWWFRDTGFLDKPEEFRGRINGGRS